MTEPSTEAGCKDKYEKYKMLSNKPDAQHDRVRTTMKKRYTQIFFKIHF